MGIVSLDEIVRGLRSGGGPAEEAWRERVGGKALGLALLVSCGRPVPPALVIETDAYDLALKADPSFARFPRQVEGTLSAAYDRMRRRAGGPLAVRSSATVEDLRAS